MGLRAEGAGGGLLGLQEEEGPGWSGTAGAQHLDAPAAVD